MYAYDIGQKRLYCCKVIFKGSILIGLPEHLEIGHINVTYKSKGGIIIEENGATTREGVYAGGDAVTGAATVISAMGAGKTAASAIDEYLNK